MARPFIRMWVGIVLILAAISAAPAGSIGQPKESPEGKKSPSEADAQYRRDAERVVKGISLQVYRDEKWVDVKRIEKPLLFYGDDTRQHDRGSVWAWGEKGRPVAVLELYQNVRDRTKWVSALCNTSGGKLRADRDGATWWRENASASELLSIPGTSSPPNDGPHRQRQIKLLAQKFTGHEFWDPNNSRYELRRLDRPLYTYREEKIGLLDGALYVLANGTNPEILLFIEARHSPQDGSNAAWQFTVGRLAHAELHLEFDGEEVFTAPRGNRLSGSARPYWVDFIQSKPETP